MNQRRIFRWVMAFVVGALITSVVMNAAKAQPVFKVATGAEKGSTYTQMFTELSQACPAPATGVVLNPQYTNGSVENLKLITENKVHGAFVQSDFLFMMKAQDAAKVANVRTIVGLHPEELHFIARADTKKEGGYGYGKFKIGGKEITFNTLEDLRGRPVGAVGGSVTSGQAVSQFSGLGFSIVPFANNDALKSALLDGTVDSILVVGGAPHALVESLDQRFRLLPVSPMVAQVLKDVYTPTQVSYSNLQQAGVPTLSTQALFVTRTFASQSMQDAIKKIRSCVQSKIPELKDTLGTHAKWQAVQVGNDGKWPLYDFK